jgi:hypothetical protein
MSAAFDDFAEDAATHFGLNAQEAADLLEHLEEQGFDLDDDRLTDWGPEAVEALDDIIEWDDYGEFSEFELDPYFPDDDWLDAGVEWELTAEYEED